MMKKDKEYLQSVIQRRIDNLPNTYEGLYIEGSRDAYELVLQDINELDESEVLPQGWVDEYERINNNRIYASSDGVTREYIHTDKLETLVVPTDLGEWLQSRGIGESLTYFSTIDALYNYWESVISSPTSSFINDNKKELIEVILGTREYRVDKPLYHALIKGHDVSSSCDIYWNYDKYDDDVFVSRLYPTHDNFLTEMSKSDLNKLGINDSNADFVEVDNN